MNDFRIYNKLNCNLFDLIGEKEPDQTKGLGYMLAYSDVALNCFLEFVFPNNKKRINNLLKLDCVVDCEATQSLGTNKKYRADIIIRFYDNNNLHTAMIIEAKGENTNISSNVASSQLINYYNTFDIIKPFKTHYLITLTNIIDYCNSSIPIISITWQQLKNSFSKYQKTQDTKERLVRDYFNYMNKINGAMEYYDVEILSVPAGNSIKFVKNPKCAIYECPIKGKNYKTRGHIRPLFMAFRAKNGRINDLYKIQDILSFALGDRSAIDSIAAITEDGKQKYPKIKERIEVYINSNKKLNKEEKKFVFIIDIESSIRILLNTIHLSKD